MWYHGTVMWSLVDARRAEAERRPVGWRRTRPRGTRFAAPAQTWTVTAGQARVLAVSALSR